ncbi:MAG TPA: hypothetical protein VMM18_05445 [Gemmatimonadaceae bacterium]|nr:hypothetical protein [Gemmatimonadaceae bacterium]
MIQGLLVGARVARTWLEPGWRYARARVLARWGRSAARGPVGVVPAGVSELLRRLEEETGSIVERALARSIEPPEVTAGSRAVRLRAATVAHVAGAGWRVGLRADEATTLAAAGSLREVDARLVEAMARKRDVGDAPGAPAFQRRLALLEVVSDAANPGRRSEHELDRLRRARVMEEVARRRAAIECIERLGRELSSGAAESAAGGRFAAEARSLVRRQWGRLDSAPLAADDLCGCAEELAGVLRRYLARALASGSPTAP